MNALRDGVVLATVAVIEPVAGTLSLSMLALLGCALPTGNERVIRAVVWRLVAGCGFITLGAVLGWLGWVVVDGALDGMLDGMLGGGS